MVDNVTNHATENSDFPDENPEDFGQQDDFQSTGCDSCQVTVSSLNLDQTEDEINADAAEAKVNDDDLSPTQLINSAGKSSVDEFRAEQLADVNLQRAWSQGRVGRGHLSLRTACCIIIIRFLVSQFNSCVCPRNM